jgi:acyl-coenzyme A thioesterase PaaI-like protein
VSSEQPENRTYMTHWDASAMTASGAWAQKRRLATAMRQVIERLMRSDAPEEELAAAADGLERYAERLKTHPVLTRYEGFAETANAGDTGAFFDQSPLIGLANPLAPPISIRTTGELEAEGRVTFGAAYEGPPGCVHGGFVAAAFDEVLGYAEALTGNPGFTGTLKVIYRNPTPLQTELRIATQVTGTERRKIFAKGQVYAGDLLTAEAEAIFVSADREKFMALLEARGKREVNY